MTAGELFENAAGFENIPISGIFCNSQKIKPGGVFVCLKGMNGNGHDYVNEAQIRGASVIVASEPVKADIPVVFAEDTAAALADLAERFYGFPAKKLRLIGVTGTNGKTTVTFMIKSILTAAGKKTGVIGTNKCFIGDKELEYESTMPTTPNGLELAEIFDIMQREGVEYVVMEVSSHALSLNRVYGLEFEVGVFTNLTRDHLDFHKTMSNYLKAKEKLFTVSKTAVINVDFPSGREVLKNCRIPAITVGVHNADITASQITLCEDYSEFTAEENNGKHKLHVPLPGSFSVYNALCAAGAARALGIRYEYICEGLSHMGKVRGRMEQIPLNTDYKVFIDYAHSPDSLLNVLKTAKEFTNGRVIVLFGCGGDRDKSKREIMGKIAGDTADFSVITSDNPRTENPVAIAEDIKRGMDRSGGEYIIVINRREAIEYALGIAQKGDVVLLCGKGQETYQIIGKEKIPFDERKIVKEILK